MTLFTVMHTADDESQAYAGLFSSLEKAQAFCQAEEIAIGDGDTLNWTQDGENQVGAWWKTVGGESYWTITEHRMPVDHVEA